MDKNQKHSVRMFSDIEQHGGFKPKSFSTFEIEICYAIFEH